MVALALGAILLTPLLVGAATGSKATNVVGARTLERYSMDAGIEWSGWLLISNPRLTTDTSFTAAPLMPYPPGLNALPFPPTELRFVPAAGGVEAQAPAWQAGGGDRCYDFDAADAGTLSARVVVDSGQVWMALLPGAASCTRPPGLPPLAGGSPYGADFPLPAAGSYRLLVGTDTATAGTVELSVPAATYDVRSTIGARDVTARLVAGYSGVRVTSWQLN
jgi:hypothetical protein